MSLANPDPTCTVDGSPTTNGVDVTASDTVTIALADTAGVKQWNISCVNTDETNVAATITAGLTVNLVAKTATFTAPAEGSALIFQSKVNDGKNPDGTPNPSFVTTFGVYVLTATGFRVGAFGEKTEGSAAYGWVPKFNTVCRNALIGAPNFGAGLEYSGGVVTVKPRAGKYIEVSAGGVAVSADSANTPGKVVVRPDPSGTVGLPAVECDSLRLLGAATWGTPITESRVVNGSLRARTTGWSYAAANTWQNSVLGAVLEIDIDPPQGAVINSITVSYRGAAAHVGLPGTMPSISLAYYAAGGGGGTTVVPNSTASDTSASTAAYEVAHNIVSNNGGAGIAHTIDKTTRRYFLLVTAESGANGLIGASYWHAILNWTRPSGSNVGQD